MAGLSADTPKPTNITVHQQSRVLEVGFDDGAVFHIPFELMRIYSPSAEVQGHGPGQEILQTGKRTVEVVALEPVGNYAVQPIFSDGHSTGIYSWTTCTSSVRSRRSCGSAMKPASPKPALIATRRWPTRAEAPAATIIESKTS